MLKKKEEKKNQFEVACLQTLNQRIIGTLKCYTSSYSISASEVEPLA